MQRSYLEFFLQERQKLLSHELVAENLGEGPDITAREQGTGRIAKMGRLVMATPDEEHMQAFDHKQLLVIPRLACRTYLMNDAARRTSPVRSSISARS